MSEQLVHFRMLTTKKIDSFSEEALLDLRREHMATIVCGRCHQRITLIAEIDVGDVGRSLVARAQEVLDETWRMLGGADEYYETLCGANYRDSIHQANIRRYMRMVKRIREKLDAASETPSEGADGAA